MAKKKLEVVNVSKFAQMCGVSSPAVNKWIATGKITEKSIIYSSAGKPQIIVDYAVPELEKNQALGQIRKTKTGLNIGGNTAPGAKVSGAPSQKQVEAILGLAGVDAEGNVTVAGVSIMDVEAQDYATAKIQEQIGKSILMKLLVQEKRGLLVDKEAQNLQFASMAIELKSALSTYPDRVSASAYAAAQKSELDMKNVLYKAMEDLLLKFANRIWEK